MVTAQVSLQPRPTLYAIPLHRIARVRDEALGWARHYRRKGKRRSARIWQDVADACEDQLHHREDEARREYLHLLPKEVA